MTVKATFSLTDEQYAYAKELVAAGRFASLSAVLQQGLDLLRQRQETDELTRIGLGELLAGRRGGPTVTASAMDKRLAKLIASKTSRP